MTEITARDRGRVKSADTLNRLIEAWVEIAATGKRPTRDEVCHVSQVSRATVPRLTSMPELAVLGTERLLAGKLITGIVELDGHIADTIGLMGGHLDVLRATRDTKTLDVLDRLSAELRHCFAVRQRWIEQGR